MMMKAYLSLLTYVLKAAFSRAIKLKGPERALTILQQEEVDAILLDMNFSFGVNNGVGEQACGVSYVSRHMK